MSASAKGNGASLFVGQAVSIMWAARGRYERFRLNMCWQKCVADGCVLAWLMLLITL